MADNATDLIELLAGLRQQGIRVTADGDHLNVKARQVIPPATLRDIAEHKPALLAHLRATLADAEAVYHQLWLRGCHLDDQSRAAKAAGDTELAARLRAELVTLIDGPYTEARRRYMATWPGAGQ
ncbi:MAG: TubC N-terminal docking domain-related protein [Chloroflexota bacterium]